MPKAYPVLSLFVLSIAFISCHKSNSSSSSGLTTTPVTSITNNSAVSGGQLTNDDITGITYEGVQWDSTGKFTAPTQTADTVDNTSFSSNMTNLLPNTKYYVRAYAVTASKTYYGNVLQFTTTNTPGKYNVTTLAGTGTAGFTNSSNADATFNGPSGVAVDAAGNVYVADTKNNAIREISISGQVSTLAMTDNQPQDVAVDAAGNVYVVESGPNLLKITPSGQVSTFATPSSRSTFQGAIQLDIDAVGNLYVAEAIDYRKITPAAVVSTIKTYFTGETNQVIAVDGNYNIYESNGIVVNKLDSSGNNETLLAGSGHSGALDATGAAASFNAITELKVDPAGNVYVADASNNKIRMISPSGVVTTIAGTSASGLQNGNSAIATFNGPFGLALDKNGNIYVADYNNNVIRKLSPL